MSRDPDRLRRRLYNHRRGDSGEAARAGYIGRHRTPMIWRAGGRADIEKAASIIHVLRSQPGESSVKSQTQEHTSP
jgi:hypothetical protein